MNSMILCAIARCSLSIHYFRLCKNYVYEAHSRSSAAHFLFDTKTERATQASTNEREQATEELRDTTKTIASTQEVHGGNDCAQETKHK